MILEEALARFKTITIDNLCDGFSEVCDCDCEKCENMKSKMIEALEKQISKKPRDICKGGTVKRGLCPNCLETVYSFDNYCHRCSQALDWRDKE